MFHQSSKQISVGLLIAVLLLAMPAYAVKNFKISNYGGAHQIWFEAEDFDELDPSDFCQVVDEAGAFGKAVTRGGSNGMVRWTFNIGKAGGKGGTWYFWGRVLNPDNRSDFMLVEGHPGDPQIPGPPYPGGSSAPEFTDDDDRIFERTDTAWGWWGNEEGSDKELQDGQNTMYIFDRQGNNTVFWDVFMWTDDPDYVPTDTDYENATVPTLGAASIPTPADGATDVPRDVALSWAPGDYAPAVNGHRVFLGTAFGDVNEGTGGIAQDASSYAPPQRLEFETTYYWRVDEVNAPPDSTVYKGAVWSFTTEPVGYPISGANITPTASSAAGPDFGPENTINGSGLDANDLHSVGSTDMWLSGDEPLGAWIQYEFDKVYKLHQMWVWNGNQAFEGLFGFGFKAVTVEYSTDGTAWTALADVPQFAKAPGTPAYAHDTTVDFGGAAAKYVKLTANSNWGGILPQYNLSEVRFFSIPVSAREPSPGLGAADVDVEVTLRWRAGREAASHSVSLSTDHQAVTDGTVPAVSVADASYTSVLDLGSMYFWRIDEVNEAETPTTWQGDVWSFSTIEYLVVDGFEDYNDWPPHEIYTTWLDGYEDPTNGSQVGNLLPPLVETTIVHGGSQSMPFFYSNTGGATYSEGKRTFAVPQNWTRHGVKTLGLFFFGTSGNTGQMYVKINGTKIPYDGEAANIARAGWQPWNIDLTVSGLNSRSVSSLTIGIDGNGATGTLYFDDIRLYPYERQFVTPVAPDAAGLIGHWTFDGNTQDSSGKGNHGTAGVTPEAYVAGTVGSNAIDLRGADYVVIDGVVNDITSTDLTISLWIKTTQSGEGELVATNNSASGHPFMLGIQAGNPYVNDGGDTQFPPAVNDDHWHLLTYVRSGNTGSVYVDGFLRGTYSSNFSLSTVTRWSIGQEWDDATPSDFYTGAVDDVRIYNYALSSGEVGWLAGKTQPFDQPF